MHVKEAHKQNFRDNMTMGNGMHAKELLGCIIVHMILI